MIVEKCVFSWQIVLTNRLCENINVSFLFVIRMMTEQDPETPIGEKRMFWELAQWLRELNKKNGRRCRDLVLPADWSKDGLGFCDLVDGKYMVYFKGFKDGIHLEGYDDYENVEYKWINNYSRARARLMMYSEGKLVFDKN